MLFDILMKLSLTHFKYSYAQRDYKKNVIIPMLFSSVYGLFKVLPLKTTQIDLFRNTYFTLLGFTYIFVRCQSSAHANSNTFLNNL
jgi:hypothetical protein